MTQDEVKYFAEHINDGKSIRLDGSTRFYSMEIPLYSINYWTTSPYSRKLLNKTLCAEEHKQVPLQMYVKMVREKSAALSEFGFNETRILSIEEQHGLCNLTSGLPVDKDFKLESFPQFYMMPKLKQKELTEIGKKKERVKLYPIVENDKMMGLSYWTFTANDQESIKVYIGSPEVPKQIIGVSKITQMGILTIYTAIVLVVYNMLKTKYVGLSQSIMFEYMPDSLALLQLCDDITLARQDGDLALEEELAKELLEIYRSPELIIQKTKP